MKHKSKLFYLPFLLLSACSDVPSGGDIEDSISGQFAECPLIHVVDAKKINGRALENNNYLVSTEFELKLEPLKENTALWEKFLTDKDIYPQIKNKHEIELNAFDERYTKFQKEYKDKTGNAGNALQSEIMTGFDEHEREYDKLMAERHAITLKHKTELEEMGLTNFFTNGSHVFKEQGSKFDRACRTKWGSLGKRLVLGILGDNWVYDTKGSAEKLATGTTGTFTMDLEMIKTENGWQLNQS